MKVRADYQAQLHHVNMMTPEGLLGKRITFTRTLKEYRAADIDKFCGTVSSFAIIDEHLLIYFIGDNLVQKLCPTGILGVWHLIKKEGGVVEGNIRVG